MEITLIGLRGLVANVAIDNPAHNKQIEQIDIWRGKFGDLAIVNIDEALEVLYHKNAPQQQNRKSTTGGRVGLII